MESSTRALQGATCNSTIIQQNADIRWLVAEPIDIGRQNFWEMVLALEEYLQPSSHALNNDWLRSTGVASVWASA